MKEGWEYKKLGEFCSEVDTIKWADHNDENIYHYIDLSAVDRSSSKITETIAINKKNAPSRAKQIVSKGDVLFGTTRPLLKRVCLITDQYEGAICSTGFCVLRPDNRILAEYIFFHLLSDKFYQYINPLQSGANYPSVSDKSVKSYLIPVLSLGEQQLIVEELDLLNGIIEKEKAQLEELDKLAQSIFYDMFGDPVTNEKGWEIKKLEDIASSKIGLTYKPTDVCDEGVIVLRSSNIQESHLDFKDVVRVKCSIKPHQWVQNGDILMCSRNGSFKLVGKVAMIENLTEQMSYGAFMTIIRSEYNHYLFSFFQSPAFRNQLGCAGTATINQITVKMLNDIHIPLPTFSLQQEFADKISAIEAMKAKVRQSLKEAEQLFNSRMDYYFN